MHRTGGDYADAPSSSELARRLSALSLRALRVYKPVGEPVHGAPDFTSAPVIGPGQYVDEIVGNQTLYYGVELAPGQSLRVSSTLLPPEAAWVYYVINMRGPDDSYVGADSDGQEQRAAAPMTVSAETGVVGTDPAVPEPGLYYFVVELKPIVRGYDRPAVLEHRVEVLGEPVVPETTAPPETEPPEAAPPPDAPAEGPGWPGLAGVGLAAVVLGGLLGDRLVAWARSR